MAAYYRATLQDFLSASGKEILACLVSADRHNELQRRQRVAWEVTISLLQTSFSNLLRQMRSAKSWTLLLEYPIPRRERRMDGVLLAEDIIFVLEFKTEDKSHSLAAKRQAEEYGLDLRDFHRASQGRPIIPCVVIPKAPPVANSPVVQNGVSNVLLANASDFADVLVSSFNLLHNVKADLINPEEWNNSAYHPVPTIIEAAEALYAGHNVREIWHSHAGAKNLTTTTDRLLEIIEQAQKENQKTICFVTGVPGAGKTLAGLNIVHNQALRRAGRSTGVFLSGNGPLVKIVSAAIARDHKRRLRESGGDRTVRTFIQNVHGFIREGLEKATTPPVEHVIVFDEAQRAWDADQSRKKNNQEESEPETLLSIMSRHKDWAVVIALVGGGQEIHTGEAGLAEWGRTLLGKFRDWKIAVSPHAINKDSYVAGYRLFEAGEPEGLCLFTDPALHLDVSLRSYRVRKLTGWVDAVLDNDPEQAALYMPELNGFPIALTRSLSVAQDWLSTQTRGERRCGLVASSGALRLRADGIELSSGFRQGNRDLFVHWFLAEPPDVRSSNQLEVAASEFECQGLELDWTGICWGGNLCVDPLTRKWMFRDFAGTRWGIVKKETRRKYLLNTYRVLMTRARQGMIIWVPRGDPGDPTRDPRVFDSTAEYLQDCGLQLIP